MADSFNFGDYADGTSDWYTGALVTSAKMHQLTVNHETWANYLKGIVVASGQQDYNFSGAARKTYAITYATDNTFNAGLGAPEFSAIPRPFVTLYDDHAEYLHPSVMSLTTTGCVLVLQSILGGASTYTGKLFWLAIGPGTLTG